MSSGSDHIERAILMRDSTLVARLLLSGSSVELPIVSGTTLAAIGEGYFVELEMERVGVTLVQWTTLGDLESTVRWMVTQAVAMQDRLNRN